MGICTRFALAVAGALALSAPAARADVVAVVSHETPSNGFDIVRVNAGTGGITPATFNTAEDEVGASVSSDGTRIVFERHDGTNNTTGLLVHDDRTGQTAQILSPSEFRAIEPFEPSISSDGQTVLWGGPFQPSFPSQYSAAVTLTSLSTFPNGPYAESAYMPQYTFSTSTGSVHQPVESGSLIVFSVANTPQGGLVLGKLGAPATTPLASTTAEYYNPAIGSPGGVPTVVFDVAGRGGVFLASRPASLSGFNGPPTPLPPAANADSALDPVFTADGRYLGFLRAGNSSIDFRLFVWDTETQTLINPAGVDLGETTSPRGLYETPVFGRTGISPVGSVTFQLASDSAVGILVQRVVGHHKLFGRTVPTLKKVGRVPLGIFRKGRHHAHWDLKVNGRRLKRGTYQVTLRSLTASKKIRDFGVPHLIHVR